MSPTNFVSVCSTTSGIFATHIPRTRWILTSPYCGAKSAHLYIKCPLATASSHAFSFQGHGGFWLRSHYLGIYDLSRMHVNTQDPIPGTWMILSAQPLKYFKATFSCCGGARAWIPRTRRILTPQTLDYIQSITSYNKGTRIFIPRARDIQPHKVLLNGQGDPDWEVT